ncbi:3-oxoadipate enol-lactonase 2 [Vibrio aerogenes CECT 7868]|uniref:3-oxoadipate enol-lactonase 2 n=1 Tax=Vibrio aerogenes CECT 7868 TaxID=1216006 RepID=A0A1M6BWV8_9VIBR|nr:alpha/beta hydrolase [Vibrio aerogenes]SHI53161.1 3-oxoadipate enol-lactonase 2 [Vibrio aerogenes CECT 7868]
MISTIPQRFKTETGLAYTKSGSGPALVLIHGVGLRLEAWMRQFEAFNRHFTVYAVDMPGHGESDIMPQCRCIEDYTDVIARWVKQDIRQPVLIMGHSMGSMIALNFASRYQEWCLGTVAFNSVFRRSEEAKAAVQERVKQIKSSLTHLHTTAPVKRWFDFPLSKLDEENAQLCTEWLSTVSLPGYSQAYEVFCHNDGPEDDELRNLSMPALFITGSDDPNSTPAMSAAMGALCPVGESRIISHAKHMAPMTHSGEINEIVIDFALSCIEAQSIEYEQQG